MTRALAMTLLDRAGWKIIWEDEDKGKTEFRLMCSKRDRFLTDEERFEIFEAEK